jgi:hypothetical protein
VVNDIFGGHGVEIALANKEDFLKIKETLTRVGIPATDGTKTLTQTCHILHKRGRYAIMHFRELYAMDGKSTNIVDEDVGRRNTISNLLAEWGLAKLVDPEKSKTPVAPMSNLKVLNYKEKLDWKLVANYTVGRK